MTITPVLIIDFIGVAVGFISWYLLVAGKENASEGVKSAINLVMWGVGANVLALVYTIIFTRLKIFSAPPIDIHHLLMTVGMLLFVFAARKFSKTFPG